MASCFAKSKGCLSATPSFSLLDHIYCLHGLIDHFIIRLIDQSITTKINSPHMN